MNQPRYSTGFSLVELSIVLVILGLLVGGILAGKSLIHAGELRKVGTDITSYRTAAFAFKDKYFAMPGDMANASSFWPTAFNGYGNGVLGWSHRGLNFWNHLQQAGLLPGSIAPVTSAVTEVVIDTHVPRCPLGNCGYSMAYYSVWTTQPHLQTRNVLVMGGPATNSYTSTNLSNFRGEDNWNIDTKYDDGQPDLGLILASGCINGTYPARTYLYSNGCTLQVDFFK